MPLRYYRLFDLLTRRGMKKTDLLQIISSPTLAKLSKGEPVNTEVICKICDLDIGFTLRDTGEQV